TRLRLDGTVRLGGKSGPPVDLLGHLTYDAKAKAFTRFDMVALSRGSMEGRSEAERGAAHVISYKFKEGNVPLLAVAFELVTGNKPMAATPPFAVMAASKLGREYLKLGK